MDSLGTPLQTKQKKKPNIQATPNVCMEHIWFRKL